MKGADGDMIPEETLKDTFTSFFEGAEPKLRHALVAAFGIEVGREAAADALAYGWERWEDVRTMDNPIGYLYRVGANRGKSIKRRRRPVDLPPVSAANLPWVEPGLPEAIGGLSERQRTCVVLLHSLDWRQTEVAELLGISVGSVRKHADRGLEKLQAVLGVDR